MKKITRLIIYVLSAAMLMQSLPVTAQEQKNDIQKTATLLDALDISLGNRDFGADTEITRAEAAIILLKFMNMPVSAANTSYYTDVTNDTYGKNEIMLATDVGLTKGSGNNRYEPTEPVKYNEALVMTARALGYGKIMQDSENPMSVVNKLGLAKGISGMNYDSPVPYAVMQGILYNALSCDVAELENYGNSTAYEYKYEKTALEKYFDVHRCSGVVTATDVTALAGYEKTEKNTVRIDNEKYYANTGSISEYLGQLVDAYYKDDNKETENTLLYVYNTRSNVKNLVYDDIIKFNGDSYTIDENGRQKTYDLAKNYSLIYNGKLLNDHSAEERFVPENGRVTLIDTRDDGDYDVVIVKDYETANVSKVDTKNEVLYDKIYQKAHSYEDADLSVYDADGYILDISDITENSILYIAKSVDGKVMEIKVSKNTVTGKLESIEDDTATIDGKEYKISPVFKDTEDANMNLGDTATFRLDPDGKIACKVSASAVAQNTYYYLLKAHMTEDAKEQIVIKVLDSDNETHNYEVSPKVKIDSRGGFKTSKKILEALQKTADNGQKVTNRQPVTIKLDEKNIVTEIDLSYENGTPQPGEADATMHKYASYFNDPVSGVQNSNETNVLSGRIAYKPAETVVFLVPADGNIDFADDADFRGTIYNKQYSTFDFMKCDAYTDKYPEVYADVLVARDTPAAGMETYGGRFLLNKISWVLDEDEQPRLQYELLEGTKVYTHYLADDAKPEEWGAEIGDIVRYGTNTKDEITEMALYYDWSEDMPENGQYTQQTATNVFHADTQYIVGGIYDVNEGFCKFFPANITPDRNTEFILGHINKFYSASIFHRNTKKAEPFDISKITTYKEAGEDYTRGIIIYQVGQPRWMYFYVD